jgi:hypothetical protein
MNNFIIAIGTFIEPLNKEAVAIAQKVGLVSIDKNGTACKVPNAVEYLQKVASKGVIGKKKKKLKC